MLIRLVFSILALFIISTDGIAIAIEDFGVYGNTYDILEPDMMEEIANKQPIMTREQMIKRLKKSLTVNYNLPIAKERKRYTLDFSYRVKHDVVIDGNVIARAGEVINPLDRMRLGEKYLFMREDQFDQLSYLLEDKSLRPVITSGNMERVLKSHPGIKIYMANQTLIDRFRISEIPAIVYQPEGSNNIVVETIPIDGGF